MSPYCHRNAGSRREDATVRAERYCASSGGVTMACGGLDTPGTLIDDPPGPPKSHRNVGMFIELRRGAGEKMEKTIRTDTATPQTDRHRDTAD